MLISISELSDHFGLFQCILCTSRIASLFIPRGFFIQWLCFTAIDGFWKKKKGNLVEEQEAFFFFFPFSPINPQRFLRKKRTTFWTLLPASTLSIGIFSSWLLNQLYVVDAAHSFQPFSRVAVVPPFLLSPPPVHVFCTDSSTLRLKNHLSFYRLTHKGFFLKLKLIVFYFVFSNI